MNNEPAGEKRAPADLPPSLLDVLSAEWIIHSLELHVLFMVD